ncbi:MAG: chromosome segregation protein SMC, partial [Alphaproteobacteria bacterium]|nr:chromosome segregation protein SMC [Alphaproteobacteria bacterium]
LYFDSDADPLTAGLEFTVHPPGKKPGPLSLLSGGEQTLTALALIFAVMDMNPPPIAVLDEVDAPLDDANIHRFTQLLRQRKADNPHTRYLVITHHRLTMARMDRLFGVTMAEKGVSTIVGVNLETAAELAGKKVA